MSVPWASDVRGSDAEYSWDPDTWNAFSRMPRRTFYGDPRFVMAAAAGSDFSAQWIAWSGAGYCGGHGTYEWIDAMGAAGWRPSAARG